MSVGDAPPVKNAVESLSGTVEYASMVAEDVPASNIAILCLHLVFSLTPISIFELLYWLVTGVATVFPFH